LKLPIATRRGTISFSSATAFRGEAHHQIAAVVGEAAHGLLHDRLPDVVEDDVDAAIAGLVEDDLREVLLFVVDGHVGAEIAAQLQLLVRAGGCEDASAGVDGELDGG